MSVISTFLKRMQKEPNIKQGHRVLLVPTSLYKEYQKYKQENPEGQEELEVDEIMIDVLASWIDFMKDDDS